MCHSKICLFDIKIILTVKIKAIKQQMEENLSLPSAFLPKGEI